MERQRASALKAIAAFSNHRGGKLYIGIDDDNTVIGYNGGDKEQQRIANIISDKLNLNPEISVHEIGGKPVLVLSISPASRLISYEGRYLTRVGSTNREMTGDEIGKRHMELVGQSWDSLASPWDIEHTDQQLLRWFIKIAKDRLPSTRSEDSPEVILNNLGLIRDNKLTNAGVLLFAKIPQNIFPHAQIRIARFKGSEIIDSHDFNGSLWDQIDSCMRKFRDMLTVRFDIDVEEASLKGAQRKEIWEYPLEALREALLNAILHRDYTIPADIQIRLTDHQLSVWNAGDLPEGISIAQLSEPRHPSIRRNPRIADILYYANLVERWGTGTTRIIDQCSEQGMAEPIFEEIDNGFRLSLSNVDIYQPDQLRKIGLDEKHIRVIQIVQAKEKVKLPDILEEFPEIGARTIQRYLKKLVDLKLLKAEGDKKGRSYTLH